MKITTVIIPAAGLGTRFLPYTKSIPKEMLPFGNKPIIHYIVEEAAKSYIDSVCIVSNKQKSSINHYFTHDKKLELFLKKNNKNDGLNEINKLISSITISFFDQKKPHGFADALLLCRSKINNNFFGIQLPDDLVIAQEPALLQLIKVAQKQNATVIAVKKVKKSEISAYGSIAIKKELSDSLFEISNVIEKPHPDKAPSLFGIVGRYVVSPLVLNIIEQLSIETTSEVLFTDALTKLIEISPVYAYVLEGERYDVGAPQGWFKAILHNKT